LTNHKPGALAVPLSNALGWIILALVLLIAGALSMDWLFPMDLAPRTRIRVILAENTTPLRAFPNEKGIWRYPPPWIRRVRQQGNFPLGNPLVSKASRTRL
jgi:hypothetical protein